MDGEAGATGHLIGLLSVIHPRRRLDLRRSYPAVYQLLAGQAVLALQNVELAQRLLNEARWLAAVLEHTGEGLFILDPRGRVLGGGR